MGARISESQDYKGQVGGIADVYDVTLSLNTSAYATGDLLADVQEMATFFRVNGGTAVIQSVTVIDKDDQGVALDLVFTDDSGTWGTENSAVSVTDAIADGVQGVVSVAAADYADMINSQIASKSSLGLVVKAPSESKSLYIVAVSRGAGTYTASGIVVRIGVMLD